MNTRWRAVALCAALLGTTLGSYFGARLTFGPILLSSREGMRTLSESLDAFRTAVEERFSHGTTAFEYEAEVEEMLRNVRRIHCSFIDDYEVRVACSLQIAWPKDV